MRKARFTDEQMVAMLQEEDREASAVFVKRHKVGEEAVDHWRRKLGARGG
jgi:hypothetical protein